MDSPLDHLLEEGIITEVVGRLQSGKEAEVFLVRFSERIVAAKVYKDRSQRSFKNKSAYQEGRAVRNTRDQRAMDRRSRFGKEAEEEAWKSAEADALYRLHAADVRVPTPVLFFEGVLLMELVVDADGITARRLIDTTLSTEQANAAYHDMLGQLVRMLACDLIHGDLSPYNVLWGASGATIIDFPQIVAAAQNSNSERFFLRDAENILGYFRAIDARLERRRGDAAEIWRAYMRRELTADFMPTGKVPALPPQRPLPIASRGPSEPRPLAGPQRGGGPSQPQPARGNRPPQQRGSGSSQQRGAAHQPARGNGPPQQARGNGSSPQARGNGSSPQARGNGSSPQARGNGSQQRGNGHQAARGNGPPQQARGNGHQQARGKGPAQRAMPEVIVRPRLAPSPEAAAASGSEPTDAAAPRRTATTDVTRARRPTNASR